MYNRIALFGESEKGCFQSPYLIQSLPELLDTLGNPPDKTRGIDFAIQSLLSQADVLFFRVEEEGFSKKDYIMGFKKLREKEKTGHIDALSLPNVGDREILNASEAICLIHKSFVITSESDLYDYLTDSPSVQQQ